MRFTYLFVIVSHTDTVRKEYVSAIHKEVFFNLPGAPSGCTLIAIVFFLYDKDVSVKGKRHFLRDAQRIKYTVVQPAEYIYGTFIIDLRFSNRIEFSSFPKNICASSSVYAPVQRTYIHSTSSPIGNAIRPQNDAAS